MVGRRRGAALVAALAGATACGPSADAPPPDAARTAVAVRDARVAESVNGANMAVYAVLDGGPADDALIGLRPAFDAVGTLHVMEQEGGMMTMRPVDRIEVPAGVSVELRPGALHGMLEELGAMPTVGDTLTLTFLFASGAALAARAPVLSMAEIAAGGPGHAH